VNWKIATATLAAVAIAAAPMAGAKPGNGNGNGNGTKPANQGQTISAVAKAGGGAAGVLGALVQLKPRATRAAKGWLAPSVPSERYTVL
jgi:hypothetical protein